MRKLLSLLFFSSAKVRPRASSTAISSWERTGRSRVFCCPNKAADKEVVRGLHLAHPPQDGPRNGPRGGHHGDPGDGGSQRLPRLPVRHENRREQIGRTQKSECVQECRQ